MKIYDISQEVFGCQVYAGDPMPEKVALLSCIKEIHMLKIEHLSKNMETRRLLMT